MSSEIEVLPCGCKLYSDTDPATGDVTLMFEPHADSCQWYAFFVAEATKAGHPPTTIDLR